VIVTNPNGFHLRPMAAFAETALPFQSQVTVAKGDLRVDGKSPLQLMGLAAEQGQQLLIEVSGPDAPAALDALMDLLADLSVGSEVSDPAQP
jgi:phosphotransferase system HPr (HPr) family protein